ncbi:hypothetical protein ACFSYH_07870 [Populibacterium corticicola]|uniref:Uncharacterized protein n=1 Tax=Populibacterium corticicola TaxID=1812826 RepID=A0ABW5XDB7_9MICO
MAGEGIRPVEVVGEEDVADITVVSAADGGVPGDLGAVREAVRGGAVHDGLDANTSTDEVVDEDTALTRDLE